jgi:hypothetical protein
MFVHNCWVAISLDRTFQVRTIGDNMLGYGLLGTIVVICVIVWIIRRI